MTRQLAGAGLAAALMVLTVLLFVVGNTTSALCAVSSTVCWIAALVSRASRRRESAKRAADE